MRALKIVPLLLAVFLAGCGGTSAPVSVLYAGSLTNLMEQGIGPGFQKQTGIGYQGQGAGSVALVNAIKDKTKSGDVFISADPDVNKSLMPDWERWYLTFARTTMVVGYSAKSRFATDFEEAKNGSRPWYAVLEQPGLRLGRTDPELDPKGYRTLFTLELAADFYHQPSLEQQVLSQTAVFPEETLETRLESGALDAGFFYLNEAAEKQLPYISLPDEVNQGNAARGAQYATVSYTSAKGQTFQGGPILYTVGVLEHGHNTAAGERFVEFLMSAEGQSVMQQHGLLAAPALYGGDRSAIPAAQT